MIAFWAVAGVLSAAAAVLILARGAKAAAAGAAADPTEALYRRQLAELDDLARRGLLGEGERKAAEAEAGRRLLAAAGRAEPVWKAEADRRPLLAAAVAAPALALGVYLSVGSPGLGDQPFSRRLEAWRGADPATLSAPEIAAVISLALKTRPDPEGYRFLAIAESASGDAGEAARALRRAVQLAPARADLWEMLGQALVMQAGGKAEADAQAAFREALARDPKAAGARFYLAQAQIAAGDRAAGLAAWRALLADLPAADARRSVLQEAIAEAEGAVAAPGPAEIRGMVEGLAARLRNQPDDREGWVRLVRAYAVLGETAKRDAALQEARARYAGDAAVLGALEEAASAAPMR